MSDDGNRQPETKILSDNDISPSNPKVHGHRVRARTFGSVSPSRLRPASMGASDQQKTPLRVPHLTLPSWRPPPSALRPAVHYVLGSRRASPSLCDCVTGPRRRQGNLVEPYLR